MGIYKCYYGFCSIYQNGDNKGRYRKKAIRREGHGNSITIKDFGDQFSRNSLDGKSHSPLVPSDGGDDELECEAVIPSNVVL